MYEIKGGTMDRNAYETILGLTDDAVPYILAARQKDPRMRDYGGQIAPEKGFAEPGSSGSAAAALVAVYFCSDSRWYKNESVLDAAITSLTFLNDKCHGDGSIDLLETNFFDCTSNAFTVQAVAYAYRLFARYGEVSAEKTAADLARDFLKHSARAMLTGGFHTPNHRWVVASALALCHRCLGDRGCLDRALEYLSEGVDVDSEGDYTERSVGIYDAIVNESLTIIADELNMPELYAAVEANLTKNIYYTEPDMTGVTLASRRQDCGAEPQMVRHYYSYHKAAVRTGDGRFAWMANRLLTQMKNLRVGAGAPRAVGSSLHHNGLLARFMLEPPGQLPDETPAPLSYDRFFAGAGVVRHRDGDWTCSLLRGNSVFLKFQNGGLKVYAKLACTFFAHGRMLADEIIKTDEGYRLVCEREWGYVKPLPDIREPDWNKIDHAARGRANMQRHRWQVDVAFNGAGLTMRIMTEGTPGIPVKTEFILPPGGLLRTGSTTAPALPGGWVIAGRLVEYEHGGERIRIGGGANEHVYAPDMRNSDPRLADRFCLYFTCFTPVDQIITIEALDRVS